MQNIDKEVVKGFGEEWSTFDQAALEEKEREVLFNKYFSIFPENFLSAGVEGADIGCGSGRWAYIVAPLVGKLHLVDASSEALEVCKKNLAVYNNCSFTIASASDLPFEAESLDFAYSLGVLHHIPDTQDAISHIATRIKRDGFFLVYLYYAFDSRPLWFKSLWKISELFRGAISKMPFRLRLFMSQLIAFFIYLPFAKTALLLDKIGILPKNWPLSFYKNCSFYTMRTDALDRFGTRLEKRFTKQEITAMLDRAGFTNIRFSEQEPYWCAIGQKK